MAWRSLWLRVFLLGLFLLGACSLTTQLPEPGDQTPGGGGDGGTVPMGGCETADDCLIDAGPCVTATCIGNECGEVFIPAGFELNADQQTPGDCLALACDGAGNTVSRVDDSDLRLPGPCATYRCVEGTLLTDAFATGTACEDGENETVCDGAGECVACNAPSDCAHLPPSSECGERLCESGACVMNAVQAGTPLTNQSSTPCVVDVCDGMGGITTENDDLDLPNDSNPCTDNLCQNGVAMFPPNPSATCLGGAGFCNNSGQCVGCLVDLDCGIDNLCTDWQCDGDGVCHATYAMAGTKVGPQDPDDCIDTVCDAVGNEIDVPAMGETPPPDGNSCTLDVCFNGSPSYPPAQLDTSCPGNMYCDGLGSCVQCNSGGQCPPASGQCQFAQCLSHTCSIGNVLNGTPTATQVPGDCKTQVCNGMGGTTTITQSNDLPNDNNECTGDACMGSMPVFPPAAAGVPCNMSTMLCDGAGNCVDCLSDNDCPSNEYCANAVCLPDRSNGEACTRASMCVSTRCVDGYCCNANCTATCLSCNGAHTGQANGVCAAITAGTDPQNECSGSQVCYGGNCCDSGVQEVPFEPNGLHTPQGFETICPKVAQ